MKIVFRAAWVCGLGLLLSLGGSALAALPGVKLADADAAQLGKSWSDVKSEGDVKYREAAKGQRAEISLPVWWEGAALRPPENTRYVLEVTFKDTASAPVVCFAASGMGRRFGASEVHRIGGLDDQKWKTGYICVGWDQILRDGDRIHFYLAPNETLPVSEAKLREATADDIVRYNAETRDWVARNQAEKRKSVKVDVKPRQFLAAKPPVAGMVAFAASSLVPVMPADQPKDEQINALVTIRTVLNKITGGSFGVYANDVALTNVKYTVSELAGPAGKLVGEVIPRTAEYALVGNNSLQPLRLWPAYAVDIPKGQSHWFVLNVRTLRGQSRPGVYDGKITITSDQGQATLPVRVEVRNVDLLTMDEAGLFMGGCTSGLLPVHDFDLATQYNQNGTNLWFSAVAPVASIKENKLSLDFTVLDEWMIAAKKRGLVGNVWFLGGDPYRFPGTMTIFRDLASIDTRDGRKPLPTAEWIKLMSEEKNRDHPRKQDLELVTEWVRLVAAHAKENNWPEQILTPFDEPAKWVQKSGQEGLLGTGPWIKTWFEDGCAAIRAGSKETRIYGSIHHVNRSGKKEGTVFIKDIDIFCTNAIHEDQKVGDEVRAAGKTFWQYSGGRTPDGARFGYGFYFASFGSVGSLHWAYNWGPGFDVVEGGSSWMYAWQTPFDTIPSPFFEGLREAWDDRRIIETYRKKFAQDADAMAVLQRILKEAQASRGAGGRDTVNDFWTAVDDVKKMDKWRDELLDRLGK